MPLIVLKAKKTCQGPYKHFFYRNYIISKNFIFWADNYPETIPDKQHILGLEVRLWTSNKTKKQEYMESGMKQSWISTTLWPTADVILKKQSTSTNSSL